MSEPRAEPQSKPQEPAAAKPIEAKALAAARKRRSIALALALGAFVVLVFIVTLVRLGGAGVSNAP